MINIARSIEFGKKEVKEYLKDNFGRAITILDVGCGEGTYFNLLYPYFPNIDGVEVFKPNIDNYELENKYNKVYNTNIIDFEYDYYDVIIFGDVIEHLSVEEAQKVLEYALPRCKEMIVALPFMYKQGIEYGNVYEIHKQDDLTLEVVKERYPYLKPFIYKEDYCYFRKRENK